MTAAIANKQYQHSLADVRSTEFTRNFLVDFPKRIMEVQPIHYDRDEYIETVSGAYIVSLACVISKIFYIRFGDRRPATK